MALPISGRPQGEGGDGGLGERMGEGLAWGERDREREGGGEAGGTGDSFHKASLLERRWHSSITGPTSSVERGNLVRRSHDPPVRRFRQRGVPETSFSEGHDEILRTSKGVNMGELDMENT